MAFSLLGTVHWFLLLDVSELYSRCPKPGFRSLLVAYHLPLSGPADYLAIYCLPRNIRTPRSPISHLFLARLHALQYSCGDSLAKLHVSLPLCWMVLSYRNVQEWESYPKYYRALWPRFPTNLVFHVVCLNHCIHGRRKHRVYPDCY